MPSPYHTVSGHFRALPSCEVRRERLHLFDALVLNNGVLRVVVLPDFGGKIASLVDQRTGRDWLWTNPRLPYRWPVYGAPYAREFDVGGFDDCFPSVAPCAFPTGPWRGTEVPEHGEVWSLPWRGEPEGDERAQRLTLATSGVRLPYDLERTIELVAGQPELRLRYRLRNRSPMPMPFLWSAHPTIPARPGLRLELPVDAMRVHASPGPGADFGALGDRIDWPLARTRDGRTIDLSLLSGPEARLAVKLWARAPATGQVALADPETGERLRFVFSPDEVTHVGLWLNLGGWSPVVDGQAYYNLCLAPAIGAQDALDVAVQHLREHGTLGAFGERTWSLTIQLDEPPPLP